MEPLYYTRIAMAGWVFMAVVLISLWASNSEYWIGLVQLLREKNDNGAGALLAFGAVVGIGAPPALGFLLEKLAATLMRAAGRSMAVYGCAEVLRSSLATLLPKSEVLHQKEAASPVLQVFFYTFADSKFIEWARRRTTQTYASLTSALAVLSGLLLVNFVFRVISWPVELIAVAIAAVLVLHGIRESLTQEQAISAWVNTIGLKVAREFVALQSTDNKQVSTSTVPQK